MNAGRELDALIAEKVMGLHVGHWGEKGTPEFEGMVAWPAGQSPLLGQFGLPYYSTSIEDAWQVVERLTKSGEWNHNFGIYIQRDGCWANFMVGLEPNRHADTAPLAICLAALKAVGVD